ncbi:MAG TPA: ATP-dependent DNA ligase, partial [Jatrophihabitantaceae bacterium]
MQLPVMPPVAPMLAKAVAEIPPGASYEPKWDGFRAVIFRDGDEVEIGSRNERPMTRYFPELVHAFGQELPPQCVIDGEIVLATGHGLDFEALQQRIHPAASRVRLLSTQTPAAFVAFDLLAIGAENLMGRAFAERRAMLEQHLGSGAVTVGEVTNQARGAGVRRVHLTPATTDRDTAQEWFAQFEGAG